MTKLSVASYSQILTILTQLATNYTNLFDVYYDMFYKDTPEDIVIQLYNDEGKLQEVKVPNRAKDRSYLLSGEGKPNGIIAGARGSTYQDLTNGAVYINIDGSVNGWSQLVSGASLDSIIVQNSGAPEGEVTAPVGTLCADIENGALYIKTTETGNEGWLQLSVNLNGVANVSLSNLDELGEDHFLQKDLSNLDDAGLAILNSKENIANKKDLISSSSTNEEYPSSLAVYQYVNATTSSSVAPLANRNLSNLNEVGENHFANLSLSNLNSEGIALLATKEDISNKVTIISDLSTDVQFPSAKAVYNLVDTKANKDGSNATFIRVLEAYAHIDQGYITYSNGLHEEWGRIRSTSGTQAPVEFVIPYRNVEYNVLFGKTSTGVTNYMPVVVVGTANEMGFKVYQHRMSETNNYVYWRTIGFINLQ